jgi:GxxExxY protein
VPDLWVKTRVIFDLKTVETIIQEHIGQVLDVLRKTGIEPGLVLDFKDPKLEGKRIVLQNYTANKHS